MAGTGSETAPGQLHHCRHEAASVGVGGVRIAAQRDGDLAVLCAPLDEGAGEARAAQVQFDGESEPARVTGYWSGAA